MTNELTIEDLEQHSGLSIRTLHYYMQMGLLPSPDKRGKYASYSQEHLDRLDLILILKELHLPLKEIRAVLTSLTPSEIIHYRNDQQDLLEKIKSVKPQAEEQDKSKRENSALDYIKMLEESHNIHKEITENASSVYNNRQGKPFKPPEVARSTNDQDLKIEIWRRVIFDDGVALSIRDTQDSQRRNKIDRLISFGRSLFKK